MSNSLIDLIGNTPLVALRSTEDRYLNNRVLAKLEGQNPAGSVKDRPALNMILQAEREGKIKPGDRLIEATSGNTGIALAMVSAVMGYRMSLIMPEGLGVEREQAMRAYGAELILVEKNNMEQARDLAEEMEQAGEGMIVGQFSNPANPDAHYRGTGPEIWQQSEHQVTHFVCTMGTTGTITGVSRYLKEVHPNVHITGVLPKGEGSIPGIRRWPAEYMPTFYDDSGIDELIDVTREQAIRYQNLLGKKEGIAAGISSGGAFYAASMINQRVRNSCIVFIVCDRMDRYLSMNLIS